MKCQSLFAHTEGNPPTHAHSQKGIVEDMRLALAKTHMRSCHVTSVQLSADSSWYIWPVKLPWLLARGGMTASSAGSGFGSRDRQAQRRERRRDVEVVPVKIFKLSPLSS